MKLSILIPTTPDRISFLSKLYTEFACQVGGFTFEIEEIENATFEKRICLDGQLEIISLTDNKFYSIGQKRNLLLNKSEGKYVQFVDSDDMISEDFISTEMKALKSDPDCLSLRGIMTTDGHTPEVFEHSLKYDRWETVTGPIRYLRFPNHINVIRADIAKQFKFPETNFGEDHAWSKSLHESGLLKNEVYIDEVLYYYKYRTKK